MPISFNEIPSNIRKPLFYAEFDNSRAVQGLALETHTVLAFGQKTGSGTAAANTLVKVGSADEAKDLFGAGSMLHRMMKKFFANNKTLEIWAMPVADNGAGVAATGKLSFTGPATAAGTLALYIGGQLVEVGVSSGDTATTVAAAVVAAITAATDLPVSAAVNGSNAYEVDITAKHKGTLGNSIDLRLNYQIGEATPAGLACTITAMASGATNPSLTTAIANMGETKWNTIIFPWTDTTSLTAINTELLDRWGPIRQNDGFFISAKDDTVGNLTTFGNAQNSKHGCVFGYKKIPNTPEEVAAAAAGQMSLSASIDPARPFQTLQLIGILAPAQSDRFSWAEANTLMTDGIAQLEVAPGGVVQITRAVTLYQLNAFGVPDTSYLDAETIYTLSYIRYSMKARFTSRYPRHKLAKDGTRFGVGQAVITPKTAKAECFALFREWEEAGLVEGFDQFKNDIIVEISGSDPNRLEMRIAPDLINQLKVLGVQIQYLL